VQLSFVLSGAQNNPQQQSKSGLMGSKWFSIRARNRALSEKSSTASTQSQLQPSPG